MSARYSQIYRLQIWTFASADQVRARGVLSALGLPAEFVQTLYQLQVDSETSSWTGFPAAQSNWTA